ncbi:myosin-like protein [Fiji disease virus]|uniref:Uncharacterized protein VP6 n=1 Tax=Fiji disease virus (isolate Sugarcane) TaxID=648172 RepID=VP6_FDVS|nr:myosin-like protein [Fiji disease virus]Q8QV05.1 RecName: Full=Uncharacterized protein VP6 [Fiji disease virus isolate Sugarcane]AAM00194.1 myosin-like protein [Fiji disease virus]
MNSAPLNDKLIFHTRRRRKQDALHSPSLNMDKKNDQPTVEIKNKVSENETDTVPRRDSQFNETSNLKNEPKVVNHNINMNDNLLIPVDPIIGKIKGNALHKMIIGNSVPDIGLTMPEEITQIMLSQNIDKKLNVTPVSQVTIVNPNKWNGFVLCHPGSSQHNDNNHVYTGNKFFVIYKRSNVMNNEQEINQFANDGIIILINKKEFKPKERDYQMRLFDSCSNVIVVEDEVDFDELSNVKICFSYEELTSASSLLPSHKKLIKYSCWPSNMVFPELKLINDYFSDLQSSVLNDLCLDESDGISTLFVVTNHVFAEQSDAIIESIHGHVLKDKIISKINSMFEKFEQRESRHIAFFGVVTTDEGNGNIHNKFLKNNCLIVMMNPLILTTYEKDYWNGLFSHFNKFIIESCVLSVYIAELIQVELLHGKAIKMLKQFFEAYGCTVLFECCETSKREEIGETSMSKSFDVECDTKKAGIEIQDNNINKRCDDNPNDDDGLDNYYVTDIDETEEDVEAIQKNSKCDDILTSDLRKLLKPSTLGLEVTIPEPSYAATEAEVEDQNSERNDDNALNESLCTEQQDDETVIVERNEEVENGISDDKYISCSYRDFINSETLKTHAHRFLSEQRFERENLEQIIEQLNCTVDELRQNSDSLIKELDDQKRLHSDAVDAYVEQVDVVKNKEIEYESRIAELEHELDELKKSNEHTRPSNANLECFQEGKNEYGVPELFAPFLRELKSLKETCPHLYDGECIQFENSENFLKFAIAKIQYMKLFATSKIKIQPAMLIGTGLMLSNESFNINGVLIQSSFDVNALRLLNVAQGESIEHSSGAMSVANFIKQFWSCV